MKVLFICSGNNANGVGIIVKNQATSLIINGIEIEFYTIKGKGFWGYIKNSLNLRNYIKENKFDLYHAHFSYSAFAATLAGCNPLIVSLMGSDTFRKGILKYMIKTFSKFLWKTTIVKSEHMKKSLQLRRCHVIPNGVDLNRFVPIIYSPLEKKNQRVIFIGDPKRKEKNYELAKQAIDMASQNIDFVVYSDVPNDRIPEIMNNADVLLLTSLYEGSPNVIKEAMACNLPIVSTDVGDIRQNIGNLEGCYVTTFNTKEIAEKISLALKFGLRTNGRDRIIELGLDSYSISKKIIAIYQEIISQN